MTYDLRRLRLHGLIERIPHTNTYTLTPGGTRVAVFYPKIHNRVLRPLISTPDQPPAPIELRRASRRSTASSPLRHKRQARDSRLKPVTTSQVPTPEYN